MHDGDGRPVTQSARTEECRGGGRARRAPEWTLWRGRTSPRRFCRVGARSHSGSDCRPDRADPARICGHGAEYRRSCQGISAIFDAQCDVEWTRRSDSRRGSFTESYPLFGYDLWIYNELFEEKLALFSMLETGRSTSGRPTISVYPPIEKGRLRTWVGVGGRPESVVRAARFGLPLTLAIIGGIALRFLSSAELDNRALTERENRAADRRPLARTRCRDRRGGERGSLAALSGHDESHRRGARMAAGGRATSSEKPDRRRTPCRTPETVAAKSCER